MSALHMTPFFDIPQNSTNYAFNYVLNSCNSTF